MEYYMAHYKDEYHDVDIVIENTQEDYNTDPLSFTLDGVTFRDYALLPQAQRSMLKGK